MLGEIPLCCIAPNTSVENGWTNPSITMQKQLRLVAWKKKTYQAFYTKYYIVSEAKRL